MDNGNNEILYSVKISEPRDKNSTGIYRHPEYKDKLCENFDDKKFNNMWEVFDRVSTKFKERDCMGVREKLEDNKRGAYQWKNFGEVKELIMKVGSGLLNMNACPLIMCDDQSIPKARFLGLYMPNCPEWNICDLGCNAYNIITVPLYDSLGPQSSRFILDQTQMETIVCNKTCARNLFKSLETCEEIYLKTLILVDEIDDEIKKECSKYNLKIILWEELIKQGEKKIVKVPQGALNNIFSICYTSGTTGYPKGVIMTNRNFIGILAAAYIGPARLPDLCINENDIHISYLPLAHIYERLMIYLFMAHGVKVGYYSGNVQTLLEDIQELKPTLFISVPRLYNRIHERIFNSLKKKSGLVQSLFNKGLQNKIKRLSSSGSTTHVLWDKLLFNKAKKILGGHVRGMLNGSAPISVDVVKKLRTIFCVPMFEGYGMTESLGASFITHSQDRNIGHIGGPVPCIEFKLVSVPEMNYLVTDNPPKGELYLRGPSTCNLGYFKLEKETNELLEKDGFIRTGDIALLSPNGSLTIIDRKKNIFKLAQGEYVAVEKVEASYKQSLFISQIFVFGYSYESVLVCVICPSTDSIDIWRTQKKIKATDEEVIKLPEFKADVINDLTSIGKKDGLKGFEQIKDIHFTLEAFTIENDLMTPTGKIKRHEAKKRFKKEIDEMYEKLKQ